MVLTHTPCGRGAQPPSAHGAWVEVLVQAPGLCCVCRSGNSTLRDFGFKSQSCYSLSLDLGDVTEPSLKGNRSIVSSSGFRWSFHVRILCARS